MDGKFIEKALPLTRLNILSSKEAGFIRIPKIHNIHTWFARRPAGPSRILSLASILPSTINSDIINTLSGLNEAYFKETTIYMVKPRRTLLNDVIKKTLGKETHQFIVVDPMAGGGSIPLEALRLGFKTIAVEYNPVAYLILKAILEFPAKYADLGLFEETLNAAKDFILKASEELGKYYDVDDKNYIFARGVRCPFCKGLIPIQGVAPEITKNTRFKKRYLKIEYDMDKKVFVAETTDTETKRPFEKRKLYIKCPYCNRWFQLRGSAKRGLTAFDKWFREHARLMRSVVEELEEPTPEMEEKLLELHIPLVKQVGNTFIAAWNDEGEKERFTQAIRDLSKEILDLQDYIPIDPIPPENKWAGTARHRGLTHWYMLFNPRQLLALAKLTKLVAEIAEKLASSSGELGAAVALYLAFAIDKIADYNTIATHWQGTKFKTGIAHTMRGESTLDFRLEYSEISINSGLRWALEPDIAKSGSLTRTAGGILPVLRFLCDEFRGAGLGDRVSVYLGDATRLSDILGTSTVDVINVDPPYFEQVIYSDKSEFFWAILRRALWPVLELLFKPGLRLSGWSWTSSKVPRDREVVAYDKRDSSGRFRRFFKEFVKETYKVLRDDGVLVLWFTHPTDRAWRSVGEALYEAGYVVSKVWPLQTEMRTRYKKQVNVVAQETSLIIVARKYRRKRLIEVGAKVRRGLLNHPTFVETAEKVVEEARKVSKTAGAGPADMMALMLGSALSIASRFEIPGVARFNDLFNAAATKVSELFITPLLHSVLEETGPVKLSTNEAGKVVEYVRRAMLRDAATRSYISLWLLSRVDLETGKRRETVLPLSYDFAQTVTKLLGYDIDNLRSMGLVGESIVMEDESEKTRKGKIYYPLLFEALSAAGAKVTWSKISSLIPGRALYLAYLSLNETGAPALRANNIRRKVFMWSDDLIAEAASIAILLIETARDIDLGFKRGRRESSIARELAIKTLLNLLPKI